MKIQFFCITLLAAAFLIDGCAKTNSSTSSAASSASSAGANSASAIAAGVAAGAVAVGSGQNVGFNPVKTPLQKARDFLFPVSTAWAATQCPTYTSPAGAVCSGTAMTLTYSGCSFGGAAATWSGGQVLTFGGTAVCGTTNLPIASAGDTLTRTMVGSIPNGNATVRTSAAGVAASMDTATATGYSSAVSGGTLISGNGGGQSISIQGINLVSSLWNHSVNTSTALSVISPGANRTIQSGTMVLQHNLLRYIATAAFNNVAFNGTSCFPQSGTITTTFTGSTTGTETLTFTGSGNATLVAKDGTTSSFALDHCF